MVSPRSDRSAQRAQLLPRLRGSPPHEAKHLLVPVALVLPARAAAVRFPSWLRWGSSTGATMVVLRLRDGWVYRHKSRCLRSSAACRAIVQVAVQVIVSVI